MKKLITTLLVVILCIATNILNVNAQSYTYSFENNAEGWENGLLQYRGAVQNTTQSSWDITPLPSPYNNKFKALTLSVSQGSSTDFQFIKKEITGLSPYTTYKIIFNIDAVIENYQQLISSIAPVIKVGVFHNEPIGRYDNSRYLFNFDKGLNGIASKDVMLLNYTDEDEKTMPPSAIYRLNRHNYTKPISFTTNEMGSAWVIVGCDWSPNLFNHLYLNTVRLLFIPDEKAQQRKEATATITVFPGKTSKTLNFQYSHPEEIEFISIYSPEGHLVKAFPYTYTPGIETTINIADLPKNTYNFNFILKNGEVIIVNVPIR